jgi:CRP-like cAMP-binding protein
MFTELDQISIFKGLTYEQLGNISGFCTRQMHDDGDILIAEGEQDNSDLFILVGGSVEIVSSHASTTSNEVVLSREDKEIFGEISWLTDARRTAGVRCHGNVEAIRIDGHALMNYLEQDTQAGFLVTRQIAILLAQRMEESNRLLKQLLWNRDI